jgi:hypothetical protein
MKTSKYLSRPLVAVCAFITLLFISSAGAQNVGIGVSKAVTKPNDEKSDLYTMDYTALLPALVNAIQEVKREKDSEITKLQAENASHEPNWAS